MCKNKTISSIKSELVPLLLECQHRDRVLKREGIDTLQQESNSFDIFARARLLSLSRNTLPPVSCFAIVHRTGFNARANTVWSYGEINRAVVKSMQNLKVPETCEIAPKTQVCAKDRLILIPTRLEMIVYWEKALLFQKSLPSKEQ